MRIRTLKQVTDPNLGDIVHEFGRTVHDVRVESHGTIEVEDEFFDGLPSEWPEPTAEDRKTWSGWHSQSDTTTVTVPA